MLLFLWTHAILPHAFLQMEIISVSFAKINLLLIHKVGYLFLLIPAALTFCMSFWSMMAACPFLIVTLCLLFTYRDSGRIVPTRQGFVIAPAEGILQNPTIHLIARITRCIISFVGEGQILQTGERLGLIHFGSQCDIYLPAGTPILSLPGQHCWASETVLADFLNSETSRGGEIR